MTMHIATTNEQMCVIISDDKNMIIMIWTSTLILRRKCLPQKLIYRGKDHDSLLATWNRRKSVDTESWYAQIYLY